MKRFAPATERNSTPLFDILRTVLPRRGTVLEIASGTGQHAVFFGPLFKDLVWQPSDVDPESLASIEAWIADAGTPNIHPPLLLDVTREPWPVAHADCVFCANMIHIAPWEATLALFKGSAAVLPAGAPLFLYGPFLQDAVETAPSNVAFDESLRERDPAWGIRRLEDVMRVAADAGFRFDRKHTMPANNLSVIFRKT